MSITSLEIPERESETVEFKRSTSDLKGIGKTLCAFLNGKGGVVYIGVANSGEPVGIEPADRTLQELGQMLSHLEPSPSIERLYHTLENGRQVIALSAMGNPLDRPYWFEGRYFMRVGTTTQVMSQWEIAAQLLRVAEVKDPWEKRPTEKVSITDLDHEEIWKAFREGQMANRIPQEPAASVTEVLERFGLLVEGKPTHAAAVLFLKNPFPTYLEFELMAARFKGFDKSEFLDSKRWHAHAFQLLEEGMVFLTRHLPVHWKIVPGQLQRVETPLFPYEALREALINALVHRWYHPSGCVSIAIYDDRIEIWSLGEMPFGENLERVIREHRSKPRNASIADVFYRRGLIEKWGRGLNKIVQLCVQAGHPKPEFAIQAGHFTVCFKPAGYIAPHRISHPLSEVERNILQVLSNGPVTFAFLKETVGHEIPERSFQRLLEKLKALKLIGFQGRGKGVRWALTPNDAK